MFHNAKYTLVGHHAIDDMMKDLSRYNISREHVIMLTFLGLYLTQPAKMFRSQFKEIFNIKESETIAYFWCTVYMFCNKVTRLLIYYILGIIYNIFCFVNISLV